MAIDMTSLVLGQSYTANDLANLWGYKSHHALIKGIFTPANENTLVLFVTKEKDPFATQYQDEISGNLLYMMGQAKHGTDARLLSNLNAENDAIYLFYRDKHHTPFIFMGSCALVNAEIKSDAPSEFVFLLKDIHSNIESEDSLINLLVNSSVANESVQQILEGASKLTQHIRYERNRDNRNKAISIHGSKCAVCGFDFDKVYGKDIADSYIEVHHIVPLSEGEQLVDPAKDLIPVCANCHRMLHHKKTSAITIDQLKEKVKSNQVAQ